MSLVNQTTLFPSKTELEGFEKNQVNIQLMNQLAKNAGAISDIDFQILLKKHQLFLETGGEVYAWKQLLSDTITRLTMAIPKKFINGSEGRFFHLLYGNLSSVNLEGLNLSFACLIGLYAPRHSFVGSQLRNACITDADLRGSDFSNCNLEGTIFSRSDLRGAIFNQANLNQSNFENCVLDQASFKNCTTNQAIFTNASLKEISY
ncbi:MAG: pentapeptide repeat-containing protein [Saprospiraceae bacterium]|nr:pentapeptide repeat-containing protein [Saprospiraceae bacterium]